MMHASAGLARKAVSWASSLAFVASRLWISACDDARAFSVPSELDNADLNFSNTWSCLTRSRSIFTIALALSQSDRLAEAIFIRTKLIWFIGNAMSTTKTMRSGKRVRFCLPGEDGHKRKQARPSPIVPDAHKKPRTFNRTIDLLKVVMRQCVQTRANMGVQKAMCALNAFLGVHLLFRLTFPEDDNVRQELLMLNNQVQDALALAMSVSD